jgi:hypothetical protein
MTDTRDASAGCRQARELGGDCLRQGACGGADDLECPVVLSRGRLFTGNSGVTAIEAMNRQVYGSCLVERYATPAMTRREALSLVVALIAAYILLEFVSRKVVDEL